MAEKNKKQQYALFLRCIKLLLAAVFLVLCIVFFFSGGFGVFQAKQKESLDEYDWAELKDIAVQIRHADSYSDGIQIAKQFGLIDSAGRTRLDNTKTVRFSDGSSYQVAVVGILSTSVSQTGDRAGITFCFMEPFACMEMDADSTNLGGWEDCDLKKWLNGNLGGVGDKTYRYQDNRMDDYLLNAEPEKISVVENDSSIGEDATIRNKYWVPSIDDLRDLSLLEGLSSPVIWLSNPDTETIDCFYSVRSDGSIIPSLATDKLNIYPMFCM